jgi:hypothetical protein
VTARRAITIGLGGVVLVLAAATLGNLLGAIWAAGQGSRTRGPVQQAAIAPATGESSVRMLPTAGRLLRRDVE